MAEKKVSGKTKKPNMEFSKKIGLIVYVYTLFTNKEKENV